MTAKEAVKSMKEDIMRLMDIYVTRIEWQQENERINERINEHDKRLITLEDNIGIKKGWL